MIETDKATIDFEAQDDGVFAKHLAATGRGELNVGTPITIMVIVEEEGNVAAFADFVHDPAGGGIGAATKDAPPTVGAPAAPPATASV